MERSKRSPDRAKATSTNPWILPTSEGAESAHRKESQEVTPSVKTVLHSVFQKIVHAADMYHVIHAGGDALAVIASKMALGRL